MQLKDAKLFRQQAYVDGAWVDADNGQTIKVNNPATGEIIGSVPKMGAAETRRAIEAADKALPAWRALTAKERANKLRRWFDLMIENQDDLARLMTIEQGKPLAEAKGEIAYAASFLEWFGEEAKRIYGDTIPGHQPDKRIIVIKQPIGVTAAITPWNFPSAMITRKAGPALAAGCTMVLKPASQTPYSALALAELAERAGIPKGVFSVVTGSAGEVGGELTSNPIVRKLTFTGSTEIGRQLMAECAQDIKKVSLELGGNAPFIVFDDADLDAALPVLEKSLTVFAGQFCMTGSRLLVQRGVAERLRERLAQRLENLRVGPAADPRSDMGPLIDKANVERVERAVRQAIAAGARVVVRGGPVTEGELAAGAFYRPTLLEVDDPDLDIVQQETFGPVLTLQVFEHEEEGVALANRSEYGLAAGVWTRDVARAFRVARKIRAGTVWINDWAKVYDEFEEGGYRQSGLGRLNGVAALDDFVEYKHISLTTGAA